MAVILNKTPIYGIEWPDPQSTAKAFSTYFRRIAETLEAALARGGIAPPAAQDLAALAGRVTPLETPPVAMMYANAAQSIPAATWTALELAAEIVDRESAHSTTVNTSRYTSKSRGWYWVSGYVPFVAGAVLNRIGVRLQYTSIFDGTVVVVPYANLQPAPSAIDQSVVYPAHPIFLEVGDFIVLQTYHQGAAATPTRSDTSARAFLAVHKISNV